MQLPIYYTGRAVIREEMLRGLVGGRGWDRGWTEFRASSEWEGNPTPTRFGVVLQQPTPPIDILLGMDKLPNIQVFFSLVTLSTLFAWNLTLRESDKTYKIASRKRVFRILLKSSYSVIQ